MNYYSRKLYAKIERLLKRDSFLVKVLVLIGIITGAFAAFFIIIGIPYIIQRVVVIPEISKNPSLYSNDWIGFWGSYLGALIGAVITLFAVRMTIRNDAKHWEKATQLDRTPFFNAYRDDTKKQKENRISFSINLLQNENDLEFTSEKFQIIIKNISRAYALNIKIGYYDRSCTNKFFRDESNTEIGVLEPEAEILLIFELKYKYDEIQKQFSDKRGEMETIFNTYILRVCYDTLNDCVSEKEISMTDKEYGHHMGKANSKEYTILQMIRRDKDKRIEFFHGLNHKLINITGP